MHYQAGGDNNSNLSGGSVEKDREEEVGELYMSHTCSFLSEIKILTKSIVNVIPAVSKTVKLSVYIWKESSLVA